MKGEGDESQTIHFSIEEFFFLHLKNDGMYLSQFIEVLYLQFSTYCQWFYFGKYHVQIMLNQLLHSNY